MKLKWQQAPVKTQWGDEMVVASVAIDKDHTVCLYCERDQTSKVDSMFAQPAQQEPVAWKLVPREPTHEMLKAMDECSKEGYDERLYAGHAASVYMAAVDAAPTPLAQRTWVGLTDEEITDIWAESSPYYHEDDFARAIEAKLKEKNTP